MRLTTSALAKAVLVRSENIVDVKKVHSSAVNNVFKKFARDTGKRDRTIVFYIVFVTFLKKYKYEKICIQSTHCN